MGNSEKRHIKNYGDSLKIKFVEYGIKRNGYEKRK